MEKLYGVLKIDKHHTNADQQGTAAKSYSKWRLLMQM